MAFFDNYQDIGEGGKYVSGDEKNFLIENGIEFEIQGLTYDAANKYGPRWVLFCQIPNAETGEPEERKLGFQTESGADTRDAMLKAMDDYFHGDNAEPVKVKLEKPGRAVFIRPAE